jgi:uncharacterized protein YndB with AHSA1/START domain
MRPGKSEGGENQKETAMNASTSKDFVISRVFDAPLDAVWKASTERERMMRWWGPKGFPISKATLDLRPGGMFHYGMSMPDGSTMWGRLVYREVAPKERLVAVVSFTDEKANPVRHPMSPTWPLEMLSTTTFAERGGKTEITIRWTPLNPTPEEQKTFDAGHESMTQGFTGTLDQLADFLTSPK